MRLTMVAVLSLVVVGGGTACSSTANGHPDPSTVAAKFGCTGYTPTIGGPEFYAATQGDCKTVGGSVSLLTFESSASQDLWRTAAKAVLGNAGKIVIGDRFAIEARDADQAAALAKKLAGSTQ